MNRFIPVLFVLAVIACDGGPERAAWYLTEEPEGATLNIVIERGACDSADLNVTETNNSVTISAYVHAGDRGNCPGSLVLEPKVVLLTDSLGDRELRGCRIVPDEECAMTVGKR